jgi:hypothetical protein
MLLRSLGRQTLGRDSSPLVNIISAEIFDFSKMRFELRECYQALSDSYEKNIKIFSLAFNGMIDSEAVEKASMNLS